MKYLEYKIVEAANIEDLSRTINRLLADEWRPWGTLIVRPRHADEIADTFYQTMVKCDRCAPPTTGR